MKVLIAGDYCPRDRVSQNIENEGGSFLFASQIVDIIQETDYAIVNFECAVADEKDQHIPKCGPNLRCSAKAVSQLKKAGFAGVTLANNHFRDFGNAGVEKTLAALKAEGLDYVGGGKDITEAAMILYKEIKGETLAIINVCENEFSIADNIRGGAAPLDIIDVAHRIKEARNNAKYALVIIHGGHEHFQYPSPRMKKLYRYFVEIGADAVVNHHQHCYSGYEVYMGKPIFYGLGNFCFDRKGCRGGIWNEGYMVGLEFQSGKIGYELYPYTQCDEEPIVEMMTGPKLETFWQMVRAISNTISDDRLLKEKYDEFVSRRSQTVITPFTPYFNEYVRAAAGRHYIPYMIPRKKLAEMLNFISCEAHRDVLIESMQKRLEK